VVVLGPEQSREATFDRDQAVRVCPHGDAAARQAQLAARLLCGAPCFCPFVGPLLAPKAQPSRIEPR
jgi:hypothetical protein